MHIGALRYTKKESIQNVGIFIKDIIDDLQNTPFTENESDEMEDEMMNSRYGYRRGGGSRGRM